VAPIRATILRRRQARSTHVRRRQARGASVQPRDANTPPSSTLSSQGVTATSGQKARAVSHPLVALRRSRTPSLTRAGPSWPSRPSSSTRTPNSSYATSCRRNPPATVTACRRPGGEPVSALDIPHKADLHHALRAGGHVTENVREQATLRVSRPPCEQREQRLLGHETAVEGAPEIRQRVSARPVLGQVEEGVTRRDPPGPVQIVDEGVRVHTSVGLHALRCHDSAPFVDDQLDDLWGLGQEAVDEARRPMGPRRSRHGHQPGQGLGMPVVLARQGLVNTRMHADPQATLQLPADRLRRHAGPETLATRQQTSLLRAGQAKLLRVTGRVRRAEDPVVRFASGRPTHTSQSRRRTVLPARYPQLVVPRSQCRRVVAPIKATILRCHGDADRDCRDCRQRFGREVGRKAPTSVATAVGRSSSWVWARSAPPSCRSRRSGSSSGSPVSACGGGASRGSRRIPARLDP